MSANPNAIAYFDPQERVQSLQHFMGVVQDLFDNVFHDGVDYGVIPGTGDDVSLFLPGMEKLMRILNAAPQYTEKRVIVDYDKLIIHYEYECRLIEADTGIQIPGGIGIGLCTSMEAAFRYRNGKRICPTCGKEAIIKGKEEYGGGWLCFKKNGGCGAKFTDVDPLITTQVVGRVLNEDVFDQTNAICKRAQKRAMSSAVSGAAGVSDLLAVLKAKRNGQQPTQLRRSNERTDSNIVDGDFEEPSGGQLVVRGPAAWTKEAGALNKALEWVRSAFPSLTSDEILQAARFVSGDIKSLNEFTETKGTFMAAVIAYGCGYDDANIETYTTKMSGSDNDKFTHFNNAVAIARGWRNSRPVDGPADADTDASSNEPPADTGDGINTNRPPLTARVYERVHHLFDQVDESAKSVHYGNVWGKLFKAKTITQEMVDNDEEDKIVEAITKDRDSKNLKNMPGATLTGKTK